MLLLHQNQQKNEDHDADPANINKTVSEIRNEIRDEDRILRDFDFTFDPEKDHYEPKKLLVRLIKTIFKMKVLEIKKKLYYLKIILMWLDHI